MSPSAFLGLVTLCVVLSCMSSCVSASAAAYSDCDSFLASLFPSLYPHCASSACKYGPWNNWFYTGISRVDSNCDSGSAGKHNRTRTATGRKCERSVEYDSKFVCQPTVQETAKILVQKLELGPPQTAATQPSRRPPTTTPKNSSRNARNVEGTIDGACKCPDLNPATARYSNTFCRNILPHPRCMRKRSVDSTTSIDATTDVSIPLEQFDLDSYLAASYSPLRIRRSCNESDPRYVLFIMDTSGSITESEFNNSKQAVAAIANSLCGNVKVALMSFSTQRYLDFCFDCYPDQGRPRQAIHDAIMATPYRGGSTRTADAIKCACEKMLTPACGPPNGLMTNNIDVVILTDGFNNGPCQNKLLEVAKCLKDEDTINIFAIAIGSGNAQTVANLVKRPDYTHIFQVKDFAELNQLVGAAEAAAAVRKCISHSGGLCK